MSSTGYTYHGIPNTERCRRAGHSISSQLYVRLARRLAVLSYCNESRRGDLRLFRRQQDVGQLRYPPFRDGTDGLVRLDPQLAAGLQLVRGDAKRRYAVHRHRGGVQCAAGLLAVAVLDL